MDLEAALKEAFPFGHPEYVALILEELRLHDSKNHDYARGGDPLGGFNRPAAIKRLYPGFDWDSPFGTCIDYMLKQFDAMMYMRSQGMRAKVEGIPARLKDMIVYDRLGIVLYEAEEKHEQ